MRVAVIHGPNLRLLGRREREVYGADTLEEIDRALQALASELEVELEVFQSNHEGEILDFLEERFRPRVHGILINPAGLTHTSVCSPGCPPRHRSSGGRKSTCPIRPPGSGSGIDSFVAPIARGWSLVSARAAIFWGFGVS